MFVAITIATFGAQENYRSFIALSIVNMYV